jgi:hypothetical protein
LPNFRGEWKPKYSKQSATPATTDKNPVNNKHRSTKQLCTKYTLNAQLLKIESKMSEFGIINNLIYFTISLFLFTTQYCHFFGIGMKFCSN